MSERKPTLIVIAGPTAVGKSSVATHLAKAFSCDILNADSRQIYQELDIGTAKPSPVELQATPHHFVSSHSISQRYTAADYVEEALAILEGLWEDHRVAILTGGTGLYIRGVLEGFDDIPDVDPQMTEALEIQFRESGIAALQEELRLKDSTYYHKVDLHNHRRIIRALSVIRTTGQAYSSFLRQEPVVRQFRPLKILLQMERDALYERINQRVDLMMEIGLLDEVRGLMDYRDLPSLQTVGYRELFDHLDGKTSLQEAIELIKRNSRRYAKRQMTWYRNQPDWQVFSPYEIEEMLKYIKQNIPKS